MRCAARWSTGCAHRAGRAFPRRSRRSTRKASAPAQGMTQSKRRSGSAMSRAFRYSSSVSGFFISACGNFRRVGALRDTQFAEILARRAVSPHVIVGQEGKARIRAARAIGINRVAGKLAEGCQVQAERIGMVGVARQAGDGLGIARLHRPRRTAQRDDAAGAAHRNMVEPPQGEPEMLRQADRLSGASVKLETQSPSSGPCRDRSASKLGKCAGKKPVRATDRVARIRHCHRAVTTTSS